jgi:hypothetical protein
VHPEDEPPDFLMSTRRLPCRDLCLQKDQQPKKNECSCGETLSSAEMVTAP